MTYIAHCFNQQGGLFRYKDFFEKGHKEAKRKDNSKKKVQFKAEEHESELDDSENDDENVCPALDLLQVEVCTYTSSSTFFSFCRNRMNRASQHMRRSF
jgi:U3 small nucleolar ribonucleoprotein component